MNEVKTIRISKGYVNRKSAHCCRHRLLSEYGQSLTTIKEDDGLWYVHNRIRRKKY